MPAILREPAVPYKGCGSQLEPVEQSTSTGPGPPAPLLVVPDSAWLLQDPIDLSIKHPSLRGSAPSSTSSCLAWRQAVLSQFSALEISGISLSVSQNSPKAPLISYSCCVAASRRLHPEHPPRWWQECRWHSPRSSGIPHPWGSPYTCREQGSFLTPKRTTATQKGQRHAGSTACAQTLRIFPSSNTSIPHSRGQGRRSTAHPN